MPFPPYRPHPHPPYRAVLGLVAALLGVSLAQAQAPEVSAPAPAVESPVIAERGVLRVGLLHPLPRLCAGQEPSQRDLRVLRLVFGLNRPPADRLAWPWYLGPVAAEGGGRRDIGLHSAELWEQPWPSLLGVPGRPGPIAPWQSAVLAGIPGLVPAPVATGAAFRVKSSDPLLPSRLSGSEWIPDLSDPAADSAPPCRHWPAGVEFRPLSGGRETYTLRRARGKQGPGLVVIGYRQMSSVWADYQGGRLDAALIEGADLAGDTVGGQSWGVELGTQQVVLRFQAGLDKLLPAEARAILSEAVNRSELAQLAPRGSFRPVRGFLESVSDPRNVEEASLFQWDSRDARQRWLTTKRELPRFKLAALQQPTLEGFAQRLSGQWEKTLELQSTAQGVEVDRLWRDWQQGEYDLMLDVVDLDDGSLQDLWGESLGRALTADKATSATWEAQLRKTLPYLPLLANVHWIVARGGAPVIQQLCPGCVTGVAP